MPSIRHHSYYDMQCNAEMMQQLINQATTTLKTEHILRTNKLALRINIIDKYVISQQVFLVIKFQGVSLSHSIDLIFIRNRASLSI